MKNLTFLPLLLLGLGACGDDGGGGGGGGDDGPGNIDAAPHTITISGTTAEIGIGGQTPKAGVTVAVFNVSDDSMITSTTSDAQGAFSLSTTTTAASVDGYLKASIASYLDTYLYPPGPLSSDFANVPVLMLTSSTRSTANSLAGADNPVAGDGWIGMIVDDAQGMAVAGAKVTASPTGQIHYNSSSGLPQNQAMETADDGIGYVMNVPAGQVTVGATKSGSTFKSHAIKARADVITLTLVTP